MGGTRRSRGTGAAVVAVGLALGLLALPASALGFGPLLTVGGPGTGAGQLGNPYGAAVGPNGHLWVSEEDNKRLSEFRPDGTFLKAVGWDVIPGGSTGFESCTAETGCQQGSEGPGAGQMAYYEAIAITPAGNIVAPAEEYDRVDVFSPTGEFLHAFGFDVVPGGATGLEVCTAATGCQAGADGSAAGQFSTPVGIGVGKGGAIWVTDHATERVNEVRISGEFVRAFGYDVVPGNAETGLEVCTAETGCQSGTSGGEAGQFEGAFGVEVGPDGELAIGDNTSDRVNWFAADLSFTRAAGYDVIPGGGAGFEICTTATGCQGALAGAGAGQLANPLDLARAPGGGVFVATGGQDRVNVFAADGSFSAGFGFDVVPGGGNGFEICSTATGCQAGVAGGASGQFDFPLGVDTDCHNGLWVSNAGASGNNVQRFGEVGTPMPPCPFALGEVTKNKRKGTAKLPVEVPSGGTIELKGRKVKPKTREVAEGGELVLTVKAKGKSAKRQLRKGKKVKVKAKVAFTPPAGEPQQRSKPIKLNRKRRR